MTYSKTIWTNEVPATTPVKYAIIGDVEGEISASATIAPVTSITPGTALNAANLNHIEDGVAAVEAATIPAILAAKGDLVSASAAATASVLSVGTNGQILIADSSQTCGLKWADRASGLLTAKGDLFTASAANVAARLAVGSPGQYLIPDSSEATGLKWVTMITVVNKTNTDWNGDSKTGNTIYDITVGTAFSGVPNTAKMVLLWLAAQWSSVSIDNEIFVKPYGLTSGYKYRLLTVRGQVANHYNDACGWIPLDSSGRFSIQTGPGAPTGVYLEVNAYMS